MSGHSKWSTIKRDKAIKDAKRSKIFSKMSRLITVAARQGGGDVSSNPALRLAVERAKQARMPKDNIERAIKKGLGVSDGSTSYVEVVYEGYGPEGVAFYIKGLTDNRNRTVSQVRSLFTRFGGSLGGQGSTAYIFAQDPENPSFMAEGVSDSGLKKVAELVDALMDNDDIQDVYVNVKLPGSSD